MIYRVKLVSGYKNFYFDFAKPHDATRFMLSALTAFNKRVSDEMKIVLEDFIIDEDDKTNKKKEEKRPNDKIF